MGEFFEVCSLRITLPMFRSHYLTMFPYPSPYVPFALPYICYHLTILICYLLNNHTIPFSLPMVLHITMFPSYYLWFEGNLKPVYYSSLD